MLNAYIVRPLEAVNAGFKPTVFGVTRKDNTRIFSDIVMPEEHNPEARPWSIISAPEGTWAKGHFSVNQFSVKNLEFSVALNKDKMYPTQTALNLQNVGSVHIEDSQFCLNEQIGDTVLAKELTENPCHTAGLVASADQNDDNVLRNVAVQGFKYGFVLGEHVVADYLYVHNCENAVIFHDCSHLSVLNHIVAQHNTVILSAATVNLFGMQKGPCNVQIGTINFECGTGLKPEINQLKYGVYDPEHRFHGSLFWHKPWGKQEFPSICGDGFEIKKF